jgi:hypothetical protein
VKVRSALRLLADALQVLRGWLAQGLSGATPPGSYQAFIRLFCRSGGLSNDLMTRVIQIAGRRSSLPEPAGQLGVADGRDARRIAESIRGDGYFVFEQTLPGEVCDRLLQFALSQPGRVRPMTGEPRAADSARHAVYQRGNPLAVRFDFETGDVLAQPDVQALLADPAILSVAQSYLGSTPIADVVSMWWHTAYSDQPDEEAAQFFHFDMDRIKWLKFFIYLTDVGPDNGPHSFVRGSHRTGGIPAALLSRGYARLSDDDIARHYPSTDVVQFVAPRGTVLAEDTRGLHKGLAVRRGDRLMLQLQFSNSLFGGCYAPARLRALTPPLRDMVAAHPAVYANYAGHDRG